MSTPLVSVVTPVLDGRRYIESTLDSVARQTYRRIEHIVIDGGSTDGTLDVLRRRADGIAFWVSEPDGGIYAAMNKGIRRADGELIGILNSDDWYDRDAVARVVDAYRATGAGVVHGRICAHGPDDRRLGCTGHRNFPLIRLLSTPFKHPSCFVTRSTYERVGLYDESFELAGDYDFMLRALKAGVKDAFVPHCLTHVRLVGRTTATDHISAPGELVRILERYTGSARVARSLVRVRHWRRRRRSARRR